MTATTKIKKRAAIERISPKAIEAVVDFLDCDYLLEVQTMLRNFLYLYIEGDGENVAMFDPKAFSFLTFLLDSLGKNGLLKGVSLYQDANTNMPFYEESTQGEATGTPAALQLLPHLFATHAFHEGQLFHIDLHAMFTTSDLYKKKSSEEKAVFLELFQNVRMIYEVAYYVYAQINTGELTFSFQEKEESENSD